MESDGAVVSPNFKGHRRAHHEVAGWIPGAIVLQPRQELLRFPTSPKLPSGLAPASFMLSPSTSNVSPVEVVKVPGKKPKIKNIRLPVIFPWSPSEQPPLMV